MLCDTNILIECLKNNPGIVRLLFQFRENKQPVIISVITITELLAYPRITPDDYRKINDFLSSFIRMDITSRIAERAALFKRKYNFSIGDAIIAATAHEHNVPLLTRDRDFSKIKEIMVKIV